MNQKEKEEAQALREKRRNKKPVYPTYTCAFTGFTSVVKTHFTQIKVPNPKYNEHNDESDAFITVFRSKGKIPQYFLDNPMYLSKNSNTSWFSIK